MTYIPPKELTELAIEAGATKATMSLHNIAIKGFMAGAFLALAAVFALTIIYQTGSQIVGAALFPVGFSLIYLMGHDLVTGIFVLVPMAYVDKRISFGKMLRSFFLVFFANFAGALTVAVMMAFVFTFGFSVEVSALGQMIASIGESRTVGYKEHGVAGFATVFLRAALCNWMVSTAVIGAFMSTTVPGKIAVMWMPIMVFFFMTFEHSVVNMFLFPFALMLGGNFSIADYLLCNEIPVLLGNLFGGLAFTAPPLLALTRIQ